MNVCTAAQDTHLHVGLLGSRGWAAPDFPRIGNAPPPAENPSRLARSASPWLERTRGTFGRSALAQRQLFFLLAFTSFHPLRLVSGFFSSSYVLSEPGATTPQQKDAASGKEPGFRIHYQPRKWKREADRVLAGSRSIGAGSGARRRVKPPEQRTYLSQQTVHSAKPSLGCQRSDRRGSHWVPLLTCQPPGLKQAAAAPTSPPPRPDEANPPSPRRFPTCSCLQQTRAERSHEPPIRSPGRLSQALALPPPPSLRPPPPPPPGAAPVTDGSIGRWHSSSSGSHWTGLLPARAWIAIGEALDMLPPPRPLNRRAAACQAEKLWRVCIECPGLLAGRSG